MPLLGSAAMLLSFDVATEAIDEHDRWHTHEHLPERLAIPGFLRGTRWVAAEGTPRYMVLYEVRDLPVLSSDAYLARLNAPSPWTQRMMPHYRGMSRGLCTVRGSFGEGLGGTSALVRFEAGPDDAQRVQRWLLEEALPSQPLTAGLGSAHLLQGAQAAAMTNEQRIRGADRGVDSAIVLTGYDGNAVSEGARRLCAGLQHVAPGVRDVGCTTYAMHYMLASTDLGTC